MSRQAVADGWPLLLGALFLVALAVTDADRRLATALFYDPATALWVGRGNLWMEEVLHTGGRYLLRFIAVLALGGWLASFRYAALAVWRRPLGYIAACMALVPLIVGGMKQVTHVHCPWDLAGFGGQHTYLPWYALSLDGLSSSGRCFPGAHSSSAFSLFGLFFLWRGQQPTWARAACIVTLLIGVLFSVAQQSRGAHFLSHDVVSAMIAWAMCAGLYRLVFRDAPR